MEDRDLLLQAVSFAARAHDGQMRKDGVTPYSAHPFRVMAILATLFDVHQVDVLVTALLHDTIEDTKVDRDRINQLFGEKVGQYVAMLSKDQRLPEPDRERVYLDTLIEAPVEVKLCKLADVLDNIKDSQGLSAASRRKTLGRARALVARIAPVMPAQWNHAVELVDQAIRELTREVN